MNTLSTSQRDLLKDQITEVLQFGFDKNGDPLTSLEYNASADTIISEWISESNITIGNNMVSLQEEESDTLEHKIYTVLLNGYDSDGEELGMGEMGDCRQAAELIISDWREKANIIIEY